VGPQVADGETQVATKPLPACVPAFNRRGIYLSVSG
jgi:hypothetical protein